MPKVFLHLNFIGYLLEVAHAAVFPQHIADIFLSIKKPYILCNNIILITWCAVYHETKLTPNVLCCLKINLIAG